jgi:hypothetical protein
LRQLPRCMMITVGSSHLKTCSQRRARR